MFTGELEGRAGPVVSSHGVGRARARSAVPGARRRRCADHPAVRHGGCDEPGIGDGDLVIAEAAVRDDGVTQQLVPPEYPASPPPEAVLALQRRRATAGARTTGAWCGRGPPSSPGLLPLFSYESAGLAAIEMELSALLVTASLRGLVAGGVLVIDGARRRARRREPRNCRAGRYDPHREVVAEGVERGAVVSLEALRLLAEAEAAEDEKPSHERAAGVSGSTCWSRR